MTKEGPYCGPYGTWPSPISAAFVARTGMGSSTLPREVRTSGNTVYWIEFHPEEDARYVLMRRSPAGNIDCITPPPLSVRSRVHEYGGGAYAVHQDRIFFVNDSDQAIYVQNGETQAALLTQPSADRRMRFADLALSPDGKWLVAVRERHPPGAQVINDLVAIPLTGEWKTHQLAAGHDFFAAPRFNPAGDTLCWLCWDHPNMPWDSAQLSVARFKKGQLQDETLVAGGPDESIYQPEWSPGGDLYFASDRSGWWNLYRFTAGTIEAIMPMEAEFGRPAWLFGYTSYAFLSEDKIAAVYKQAGDAGLGIIDVPGRRMERIESELTSFELPSIAVDKSHTIWFLAGSSSQYPGLWRLSRKTDKLELVHAIGHLDLPEDYISRPEHIAFPSTSGRRAYAYFYPAHNPDCCPPAEDKPPLIVTAHGGPTSCARPHLDAEVQFWTSRGFALLDVDYTGSSGYGRDYRRALYGNWGLADVEDCVYGARFLVDAGRVAPGKLLIRGRSAGGFLALAALTFFDTFAAGASYFGIGDLMTLARNTHKFEEHYLDRLVGPLPQSEAVYRERSPLSHLAKLKRPVILFQGLEDRVVPLEIAQEISNALEDKKLPYAMLTFPGEGHGFKKPETIAGSLEAELEFYQRMLGFTDENSPMRLEIHNLFG
jgi:dipeptidyl aminopeptidase/acylaminoacyl peptidase